MQYIKDPAKFFEVNYDDIVKITLWALNRSTAHDELHDIINSYYIAVVRNRVLDKYDPSRGCTFETYLCLSVRTFIYSFIRPRLKTSKTDYLSTDSLIPYHDPDLTMVTDLQRFKERLTAKERKVLNLLATDHRPHEICKDLHVSNMLISYYRNTIHKKWLEFIDESYCK